MLHWREKWLRCDWPCNYVLKFQWPFAIHCNSMYFYGCECYQTSCMSYNGCNSLYVKLYTYATHATRAIQLQLCTNNYYVVQLQLVCKYSGDIIFMLLFIDSSKFDMWHYGDFYITTKGVPVRLGISLDFEWSHWFQSMGPNAELVNSLV
jgi:hypothetical protein